MDCQTAVIEAIGRCGHIGIPDPDPSGAHRVNSFPPVLAQILHPGMQCPRIMLSKRLDVTNFEP
jgi:hypothetical protein